MMKDIDRQENFQIVKGNSVKLEAAYIGEYHWSNGATTRSITVSPAEDTDYQVRDTHNCILNEFSVKLNPLPVKLIALSGANDGKNLVTLKWSTAFENNFSHFEVEKSPDAINFTYVGKVESNKNSQTTSIYNFNEQVIADAIYYNDLYYRLKMVSLDDGVEYSRIVRVNVYEIILGVEPPGNETTIEILPNPASKGQIFIRLVGQKRATASITVYDISGNPVWNQNMQLTNHAIPFLPKNIASGTYVLNVQLGSKSISRKFVLLE